MIGVLLFGKLYKPWTDCPKCVAFAQVLVSTNHYNGAGKCNIRASHTATVATCMGNTPGLNKMDISIQVLEKNELQIPKCFDSFESRMNQIFLHQVKTVLINTERTLGCLRLTNLYESD